MLLIQFTDAAGKRHAGRVEKDGAHVRALEGFAHTCDLVLAAWRRGRSLSELVDASATGLLVNYDELLAAKRVLPPLDHPDSAHCLVTGTGLTHLGSAQARDSMHSKVRNESEENLTDSMKLFRWGLECGKPAGGGAPVQPEWFYKGDGSFIVAPEHALERPAFAEDGGEEPEIVGLYVIADDGTPLRAGFALGNEFSDHVMERRNYLYLAHSKLRQSSFGPELYVGELPASVEGTSRILRGGEVVFSAPFLTGEANMSYTLAGLEHHHFKYREFRRPGDVHCHFLGTSTLSFAAGVRTENGDIFEISGPPFSRPLRNPLRIEKMPPAHSPVLKM